MPKTYTRADERATFKIVTPGGNAVSFAVKGSAVTGIREAFGWLPASRRAALLIKLNEQHAELCSKEDARAAAASPAIE